VADRRRDPGRARRDETRSAEDVPEERVPLDECLPADFEALDVGVEADDPARAQRRDGQEDDHVGQVAVDDPVGDVPVPEVEQGHHERAEERREAGQRAEQDPEADEELAERDGHVDELDEPRGRGHPREDPLEGVAVGRRDVRQVTAGAPASLGELPTTRGGTRSLS
jgi:hypothetical protein